MERALVTGGAGFIGSHLVDALIGLGLRVRVVDSLEPQVHGTDRLVPAYLNPEAELVQAELCNRQALEAALQDVQVVFHEASAVGVGQSMYEIERYVAANSLGTAVLLDLLANQPHSVRRLVVASSMSLYGEGSYRCPNCGPVEPLPRDAGSLAQSRWDPPCPICHETLAPQPTPETKPLRPASIYALTKQAQEEMCLCVGKAYGIPTVALRYFNVYGTRQALSNPYTGVAAIFASRAMKGKPPIVYEDGAQTRDFVHISDIVQANLLAMKDERADFQLFNVGTGRPLAILEVAQLLCRQVGPPGLQPEVSGRYRQGDVRHCYPDISKISALGYRPRVTFEEGIQELAEWVRGQTAEDRGDQAVSELERRGLVRSLPSLADLERRWT